MKTFVSARLVFFLAVSLCACASKPAAAPATRPMALAPNAPLCLAWSEPEAAGKLDTSFLPEASGIAVSRQYARLYHLNDSGDGGVFYVTKRDGTETKKVSVEGFQPLDTEDLALGACGAGRTCLFLGDIGDNKEARQSIDIWLIEESAKFATSVKPLKRLTLRYPDRAHNAEALAVHPNGDLFIVTKEMTGAKVAQSAQVFRLSKKDVEAGTKPGEPKTLRPWGRLDVPAIVGATGYEGLVTGMSIAPKGERVLFLTYDKALEIAWDLASAPLPAASELATKGQLSLISIRRLNQQEAISYDENGNDFIYNTERFKALGVGSGVAEIIRMRCR